MELRRFQLKTSNVASLILSSDQIVWLCRMQLLRWHCCNLFHQVYFFISSFSSFIFTVCFLSYNRVKASCSSIYSPLRSLDRGPDSWLWQRCRWQHRSRTRQRVEQRGLRISRERLCEIRHRLLETRFRHHSPGKSIIYYVLNVRYAYIILGR